MMGRKLTKLPPKWREKLRPAYLRRRLMTQFSWRVRVDSKTHPDKNYVYPYRDSPVPDFVFGENPAEGDMLKRQASLDWFKTPIG